MIPGKTREQIRRGSCAGQTLRGDYAASLLVLIAAVMKADGRVMKSELEYVRRYFVTRFGEDTASEAVVMLRDILKQEIPLRDVTRQLSQRLEYSYRLEMLHFLFGIASADGTVSDAENQVIEKIAGFMSITDSDFQSIRAMFVSQTDSSYKILEIEPTASDEEVKKAYRSMAMKYHPDKVSHLGEDFKKVANEKFRKVQEAYDKIKKERGLNRSAIFASLFNSCMKTIKLKDILSISGKGGLFKFIAQARNGVVVESMDDHKRHVAPATARVSSLEDIAIFTQDEEVPLSDIFMRIHDKTEGKETISHKATDDELKSFFVELVPDYDDERVYMSDIKKVFQWYNQLHANESAGSS